VAGGRRAPLALDVDKASPAGAERATIGILAELRQRDAEGVDRVKQVAPDGTSTRRPSTASFMAPVF